MTLSDMGAEVLRVDRTEAITIMDTDVSQPQFVNLRGRRAVAVDLKRPDGVDVMLRLIDHADAFVEGFRPGVAERLGIGPDVCLQRNPRLVYARVTGWGQDGPWSRVAGHDINYVALTGLLNAIGPAFQPLPPLNLVGDFGGGGLLLAFGIVCALLEARSSGAGQVVDAAMVDGIGLLGGMFYGLAQVGAWHQRRACNALDGGAHFYGTYETADGRWISIGAIEPKFYAILLDAIGIAEKDLPDQYDEASWPASRQRFAEVFRSRTQAEWSRRLGHLDVCYAPVLSFDEAFVHEHAAARGSFIEVDGVRQPAPAPRFSRTPGAVIRGAAEPGQHTREALLDWGFAADEVERLQSAGVLGGT